MTRHMPADLVLKDGNFPSTIPKLLQMRAEESPEAVAFCHYREGDGWIPTTWADYWEEVQQVAAGLKKYGVAKGSCVAIMLPTCKEWDIMDRAALMLGAVVVGIEPHASSEHIEYIMEHSAAKVLFVKDALKINELSTNILQPLDFVVVFKESESLTNEKVTFVSWQDVHSIGTNSDKHTIDTLSGSDPATLVYTSGTTGTPKGILYTHKQVVTACESILEAFGTVGEEDKWICWLPLANLFQRIINLCAIGAGTATYLVADPRQVMDRIQSVKPSVFIGVPRFYEKLYAGIQARLESMPLWKKKLVRMTIQVALRRHRRLHQQCKPSWLLEMSHSVLDRPVLGQLRKVMGGNIKFMLTGSAPCPKRILEFFDAIGLPLLEAYGMSENVIPLCANRPDDYRIGTVGKPLRLNEIRVASNGEVLVKGPGMFAGYYRSENQIEGFTSDGFFKTSDYGFFDEEGFLHLTERKSEIIKTSTGRRISLVRIEDVLRQISIIDQIIVVGSGQKVLVAIITLDQEQVRTYLKDSKTMDAQQEIPPLVRQIIAREIDVAGQALASYERIRGCILLSPPFSVANGELTPNLKPRRTIIENKYSGEITRLYQEIESTRSSSQESTNEVLVICP